MGQWNHKAFSESWYFKKIRKYPLSFVPWPAENCNSSAQEKESPKCPTRGTEPQLVRPPPAGWPAPLPPPWVEGRPACAFWPGGRWCVWVPCTSWEGWWCACHCGGCLSWNRRGHQPWSWPKTCKTKLNKVRGGKKNTDREKDRQKPYHGHKWGGRFPCCDHRTPKQSKEKREKNKRERARDRTIERRKNRCFEFWKLAVLTFTCLNLEH